MSTILHRVTIEAPTDQVAELIANRTGVERWWTGQPVAGDDNVDGTMAVHFVDPAASFEIVERDSERIVWRCVEGPGEWIGTRITFALRPHGENGTTLLFSHEGWQQETEFMHGCSTNWAAYLMSLKSGAEGPPFPRVPRRRDQPLGLNTRNAGGSPGRRPGSAPSRHCSWNTGFWTSYDSGSTPLRRQGQHRPHAVPERAADPVRTRRRDNAQEQHGHPHLPTRLVTNHDDAPAGTEGSAVRVRERLRKRLGKRTARIIA